MSALTDVSANALQQAQQRIHDDLLTALDAFSIPEPLKSAVHHAVMLGGKRVRPALCYATAHLNPNNNAAAVRRAAVAAGHGLGGRCAGRRLEQGNGATHGRAPVQPFRLEGGNNEIGSHHNGDGLGKQQPEAVHGRAEKRVMRVGATLIVPEPQPCSGRWARQP